MPHLAEVHGRMVDPDALWDLKGKRWIGQGVIRQIQASQRVTTSSIEPS